MLNNKISKLWLVSVFALSLVPAAAWGATGDIVVKRNDLDQNDLTTFNNFWVEKKGRDPESRLVLHGTFYKDCEFQIRTVADSDKAVVGYQFTDQDGKGRQCMADHKKRGDYCGKTGADGKKIECTELSKRDDLVILLSNHAQDAKIQMLFEDNDEQKWVAFPGKTLRAQFDDEKADVYVSESTSKRLAKEKAARERADLIAKARRQAEKCRKTVDSLQTARDARDLLQQLNAISSEDFDKITADIEKEEYNVLMRKFATLKPDSSEREEVASRLAVYGENDPKIARDVALAYSTMAKKMISDSKSTPESFDNASVLIREAQDISGLEETDLARLRGYERDLSVGKYQKMAQSGASNNQAFWQDYSSFMRGITDDVRNSCSASSGAQVNMEDCQSAQRAYMTAQQVPQVAQQAQYEQYMMQARMQQQMMQMNQQMMQMGQMGPMGQMGQMGMMGGMNQMGMSPQMAPMMNSSMMMNNSMGMGQMGMGQMGGMGMRSPLF